MNVEIILNDEEKKSALMILNTDKEKFVQLIMLTECDRCVVSIEDIKLALRKLSAK